MPRIIPRSQFVQKLLSKKFFLLEGAYVHYWDSLRVQTEEAVYVIGKEREGKQRAEREIKEDLENGSEGDGLKSVDG